MKNKLFLLIFSIAMAASLSMLAGCSSGGDDVDPPAYGLTSEVITRTNGTYLLLTWSVGDNAGSSTSFFYQKEGENTMEYFGTGSEDDLSAEGWVYDKTLNYFVKGKEADAHKKGALIRYTSTVGNTTTLDGDFETGEKYRFGVRTDSRSGDPTTVNEIMWTGYIDF